MNCPQTSAKKTNKSHAKAIELKAQSQDTKGIFQISLVISCLGFKGTDVLFGAKVQKELYATASKRIEKVLRSFLQQNIDAKERGTLKNQAAQVEILPNTNRLRLSLPLSRPLCRSLGLSTLLNSLVQELRRPVRISGLSAGCLTLDPNPRLGYALGQGAAFDKAEFALTRTSQLSPLQEYQPRHRQVQLSRMQREAEIRMGLRRGEFVSYFQPKIDPRTKEVVGGEALVRWQHPEKGLLMPKAFIGLAEESSLICDISQTVAKQTVALLSQLKKKAKEVPIAINLSQQDLKFPDLIEQLGKQLKKHRLSPALVNLEVSERITLMNENDLSDFTQAVRQAGFSLALDDFGTAYSGLLRLLQLPISEIKVDRLFLVKAAASSQGREILRSLVSMLLEQNYRVTVEGVEKPKELKLLESMPGCFAQGFFFSPAVDAKRFQSLSVQ